MKSVELSIKTKNQEGCLANEYNPLRNIINEKNEIVDFNTDELNIDLNNPLSIECQPSYDGTVNLIINDDKNPPRIINTRFTKLEDNKYKIINRNQLEQTNLYKVGKVDQQTRLFRNINKIPKFDLLGVYNNGHLKGGNYTFYLKLADNDYNKTDIVAESGQISIFKGYINKVSSISGALLDELTDKAIQLKISNIDTSFSKFYLYFVRETSDTNGVKITKAGMFSKPYEIKHDNEKITINGLEEIEDVSIEELNIKYNLVTAAKTQVQVQNMLFFGNVQGIESKIKELQNISYFIDVSLKQDDDSIGWIKTKDYTVKDSNNINQVEYYNPNNIYYRLGYWPDEMYRLGIVYIMKDDSLSPVFNLRGCEFKNINESNLAQRDDKNPFGDYFGYYYNGSFYVESTHNTLINNVKNKYYKDLHTNKYYFYTGIAFVEQLPKEMNYITRDDFLSNGKYLDNSFGVFKNPNVDIINHQSQEVKPLYYKIALSDEIRNYLKTQHGVKGYFIVRQKRTPTTLCQGFSIGIDRSSYVPMLFDSEKQSYVVESFLSESRLLTQRFVDHIRETKSKQCSGLISLEANVNPVLKSNLDGSEFVLRATKTDPGKLKRDERHYFIDKCTGDKTDKQINTHVVYVNSDTPLKHINGCSYSTRCGAQEDVSQFSFFEITDYSEYCNKILRGVFCPILGVGASLQDNTIYDIKIPNYSVSRLKDYFEIRGKDNSAFYAISDRISIEDRIELGVFRGDCYTNTVSVRLNRNFVDSDVPVNELIVNTSTWKDNYKGYTNTVKNENVEGKGSFNKMNRADINTVNLGMWVTYKCLSSNNLGLRSEDTSHIDEITMLGSNRSFFPLSDMSVFVSKKVEESWLLNEGYGSTLGHKRNFIADNIPYVKQLFDNRVMFSNVQQGDDFKNAYRIFQGLSYKDIDRQYGAIVKFVPFGVNILCIFEHGIGIIPINEKALIQTNTDQSIHMYGAGVIQNQISLISGDFGSIWPESIIKTPIGIYGVDTHAKKIWRVSERNGLEIISDMRIQQFLNNNIILSENDKYPVIGLRNVKTHYNNYKGDVMFTFYNYDEAVTSKYNDNTVKLNNYEKTNVWNMCFNERMDKWITRYSWTPLYSENINNIFYSTDRERTKVLGYIYNNIHCTYGVRNENNEWKPDNVDSAFSTDLSVVGYSLTKEFKYRIDSVETSIPERKNIIITDTKIYYKDKEFDITSPLFYMENNKLKFKNYGYIKKVFKDVFNIDFVPIWYKINISITLKLDNNVYSTINDIVGIVVDDIVLKNSNTEKYLKQRKEFLRNGFYVHGRAGIFNEMKYDNKNFDDQILPTKWYEKQEPFEFEFVVNEEIGLHKVFDNLIIISNNVKPNQLEFEIEGDVYNFNKAGIFRNIQFNESEWDEKFNKPKSQTNPLNGNVIKYQSSQKFDNCKVVWDTTLNSYSLNVSQDCKDLETWGRRLGNIKYVEDSWYLTISPIIYKEKFKIDGREDISYSDAKQTRIRDKYCKIRIKYTGEETVIITALKTIYTNSYA